MHPQPDQLRRPSPLRPPRIVRAVRGGADRPILEDVVLCERLIAVTTPLLLSPAVVTDARKLLKTGVWLSFLRVLLVILHVEFHLPILPRALFQDLR